MNIENVIKILTAKVECMKREVSGMDLDCTHRNCDECVLCYAQGTVGEQIEAIQDAIDLLEINMPKKPNIYMNIMNSEKYKVGVRAECPNCGDRHTYYFEYWMPKRCNWCGQALDWEEVENEAPTDEKYRRDIAWAVGFNAWVTHCNEHAIYVPKVIEADGETPYRTRYEVGEEHPVAYEIEAESE